jgi:hypothetical protein
MMQGYSAGAGQLSRQPRITLNPLSYLLKPLF